MLTDRLQSWSKKWGSLSFKAFNCKSLQICYFFPFKILIKLHWLNYSYFLIWQLFHLVLWGVYVFFTVAKKLLPPSHSVYIALLLYLLCAPAPRHTTSQNSCSIMGRAGAWTTQCCHTALPQLSLTAHHSRYHGGAGTPATDAVKLRVLSPQIYFLINNLHFWCNFYFYKKKSIHSS